MKVLYIGSERSEAQAVANALRSVDDSVSVLWAAQLENAANWLGENRGLDALVMDAPIDGASCLVVQKQLRRLALPPAVVFLVPDGIAPTLDSLHPGGHYLRRNESLSRDLPIVITRALESAARADLEQKLARAAAAREDAEQRQQTAADQLAALQTQYEVGMARAAATWDMVDEQLRTAAREVESARQREESAAADVARLSRRESELSSQLADAAAAHSALARQLGEAQSAIEAAHAQTEHERTSAAAQLREREREFETQLARALDQRQQVEAQLAHALEAQREVEAQLDLAISARSEAERQQSAAMSDVARLSRRESELSSQLADAAAAHSALARQLAEAQSAIEAAHAQTEHERASAAAQLREREREFETQLARALDQRQHVEARLAHAHDAQHEVEAQLAHAVSARSDAERQHAAAMSDVARLTTREAELNDLLAEITASRNDLDSRLAATQAAFDDAMTRATRDRLAASKKAAEREAELDGQIQRERTARATVEQTLADVNVALDQVRRDHHTATVDRDRWTAREADLTSQLADLQARRDALETAIADAEVTLRDAQQRHESALAAAVAEHEEQRVHFDRRLSDAATEREGLTRSLIETQSALDQTRGDYQSAKADVERLTSRESALVSELADVCAVRDTLERRLGDAAGALSEAHAREADLTATLQQQRSERATLEQRLESTAATLDAARRDYQAARADVERLTSRESDLQSELAGVQSARDTLERQLADVTGALREAEARETDLAETLQRERSTRAALEQRIEDTDAALNQSRRDHESTRTDIASLIQREAQLASQLAETEAALEHLRHDYQSTVADVERLKQREADLASQLVEAQAARHTLERQLTDASTAIREAAVRETELNEQLQQERTAHAELDQALADAKAAFRDAQAHHDTVLTAASAERDRLALRLEETDSALEQVRQDFTGAVSEIDRLTAREGDLASQLVDAQAIRSSLEQTLTDTRARFVEQRQQLEIQLAQEQLEQESYSADMDERYRAVSTERDTLQQSLTTLQERARQLQESLTASVEAFEVSRAESHRLFDHAGVAMFRCTRDGVLADVNRALTTLIGRRTYELASADFATAVFEAPQALSWLIERCISTRAKESIETTWRRQDGGRLFVRLSARSLPSGLIEVVADDLTRLRVLEERLGQAQRMEALGRLASEVAITCGSLLANIQEQGREWVSSFPTHSDARQRGEELFDDVGRAVGFLQELAACGEEQTRTPMLVDLNTLVRDLEPVLKNVVGADVEVALRDTSTPLNVDVNTERIERLLVNLASYGRGRMPAGGRLRIELGTSVVDRHFSAKHPNVRLGLHALITVTETRAAREEDGQSRPRTRKAARPGVDFATLQGLVSDCGGHLWMKVHPLGEMVAKIRLPLVTPRDQRAPRALTARTGRERQAARWFQS
jgi:PAS domain S-box-containing protein